MIRECIVRFDDNGITNAMGEMLEEIVRCKDCKAGFEDYPLDKFPNRTEEESRSYYCDHDGYSHDAGFFCGYGERGDNT